ncbi:MAG: type VI secretion system baseplate subunit TssG, partial [Deltaproteobacteria bacterium]|nr:type VI secretion system baseplate subunit TssG [Deltaproteobacteria bacterium]
FTEHVARHQGEGDALQDFLDAVNHRLVSLLHASWRKYRYYVQYRRQAVDPLSARFLSLIGARSGETRGAREIQWPRLLAYMGLIALNGEAAGSLESILRHYFGRQEIRIVPCIRRWVAIPGDQQTRLGTANRVLGEDFILGDEVEDQTGKFRISISQLGWEDFLSFLPCREKFHELRDVVKFVMKSRLSFDVELRLKPGEVREWRLGGDDGPLLGWNTWSGEGGDGVLVLDTNHEEV